MKLRSLSPSANPFAGKKVVILGDVMIDTFVYGEASRISPEAPVPVVLVSRRERTIGGAGNVARNLADLGAVPLLAGLVGKDSSGTEIQNIMQKNGIAVDHLVTSAARPTTSKTRIVAQGQQVVRIDDEVSEPLSALEREALKKQLWQLRKEADVIVVSDYAKGVVDQEMFNHVRELWGESGKIVVDPKPRAGMDYKGAFIMTPNLKEASELLGEKQSAKTDADAAKVVQALRQKFAMPAALLTRAGDGMTLSQGEALLHLPVHEQVQVRDVSGAGDTVISVIAASLAAEMDLTDAVELANISGSLVVSKPGTATVSWPEISAKLEETGKYPVFMFRE